MDLLSLGVIAGGLLIYSLISGRLQGTIITTPLIFIVFGFIAGSGGLNVIKMDVDHSAIHFIAEFTLVLVLFTDAARIDLSLLRRDHNLPVRMLILGLPLTIIAGLLIAVILFPQFLFWEAALLAALLAPTDAALGQAVVSAKVVPVRIRQAINVESGLNDGLALPAVLLFAALASAQHGATEASEWVRFAFLQLTLGPIIGVIVGLIGTRMLDSAVESGRVNASFQGIGILSLAIFIYVLAELSGGNGFIAAFVGGMVFGNTIRHPCTYLFEFMESEGQLLMLIAFLVFGAVLLPEGLEHANPTIVFYAVLSLTVIRMIPIALSLVGAGAGVCDETLSRLVWSTRPRVYPLRVTHPGRIRNTASHDEILAITVVTVALSAILHGVYRCTAGQTLRRARRAYGRVRGKSTNNRTSPS